MLQIRRTNKFDETVTKIAHYLLDFFGELSAQSFLLGLEIRLSSIARFPLAGVSSNYGKNYRRRIYKKNILVYKITEDEIIFTNIRPFKQIKDRAKL